MLILFLLVAALYIFLGLFRLGQKSLWADEAMTIGYCYKPLDHLHVGRPFYYLFLRLWCLFADSEFSFRLPSVVFGAGSLIMLFLAARKLRDSETALIASLLFAISSGHIYYAQEVKFYTMLTFTALLQMWFFTLLIHEFKWSRFILYWAAVFLCLATNPTGILINIVQNAYLLVNIRRQGLLFRRLMITQVVLALLGIPLIVFLWKELIYFLNVHYIGRMELPTLFNFNKLAMYLGKSLFRYYSAELTPMVSVIGAAAAAVSISNIYYIFRKGGERNVDLVVMWFLVPILLLLVLGVFDIKLFYHRYIFFLAPAAYLNIAVFIRGFRNISRYILLAVLILVSSVYLVDYYRADYRNGENWRAVAERIERENLDAQVVLVPSYTTFAFGYYYKKSYLTAGDIRPEITDEQIQRLLRESSGSRDKMWLVILGKRWTPVTGYLEKNDLIIKREKINRIRIILAETLR